MEEKKKIRTEASRKADKKYNEKSQVFTVCYRPTDIKDGLRLKAYLNSTNQSANSYIKSLVKADLDNKGIPYNNIE